MNYNNQIDGGGPPILFSKEVYALMVIAGWVGIYYLFYFLFTQISISNRTLALIISGLVCSLSTLGVIAFLVNKNIQTHYVILTIVLCLAADVGINMMIQEDRFSNLLLHLYAGINITLIGIALCGGILISGIVKKPTYLIPLAVAAGISDIWSVAFGVTREIVKSKTAMNYVLFSFPVAEKGVQPIIGVTDFIFAAMFLSLSYRFNMPVKRTQFIVALSFIISISIAVLGGFGVPVLPVMGLLFILGQYEHIKMVDPKEKRDAFLGILIIVGVLVMVTLIRSGIKTSF